MDPFDEILRERAKREPFPVPEDYAGKVFRTCAALKETDMETTRRKTRSYRWLGGLAAALAVFVAIPNISPAAAAALREVPVLGAIVEVITFRNYSYDDGHSAADVKVPELGGSGAAAQVNDQVQAYTDQLIEQFQADCQTIGEGYQGLDVTSSVVTDTDGWFTLRIDATRTQASGYTFSRFYHIDKATGEQATLSSLFRPDADYVTALSAEVKRQMEEQPDSYFLDEFASIEPEQSFYPNGDGQIVLVFDEYAVAPGFMGMVEFPIPASVTEGLLR